MAKQARPGRTLIAFLLLTAVLGGLAALTESWVPRLGLDLEGGTRITLTAESTKGLDATKLQQAAAIIDARVNGTGVAEAEVTTQGDRNVVVEIPGENRKDLLDAVRRTAQLRFRVVATGSPIMPSAEVPEQVDPDDAGSGQDAPADPDDASGGQQQDDEAPDQSGSNRVAPMANGDGADGADADQADQAEEAGEEGGSGVPEELAITEPRTVQEIIAWSQNPDPEWMQRLVTHECEAGGTDDPDQPLLACDEDGNRFLLSEAIIEGTQLRDAAYGTPPQGAGWAVTLSFKGEARKTFADTTRALFNNGGQFAIVLDSEVISYAGVNEPILDGNAQITGDFSEEEARSLSNSLKFGALPIKFAGDPTIETIGPSLAGNQLSAGILAGLLGLALVVLFAMLYYRGLGIVIVASLAIAAVMTYFVVLILSETAGFALTLPGIAGLIVGVGITADSFIIYFERIRDDMREGKSMRVAVETGWDRAWRTCVVADLVGLLAAVVLYIFAIGVVRGFAFTLGIATVIDLAIFFWFTKPMVSVLARRKFFNSGHKLSGLSVETLGTDRAVA